MPVYLCKSGWGTAEPWRHGIPVYAYPFPMYETPTGSRVDSNEAVSGSRPEICIPCNDTTNLNAVVNEVNTNQEGDEGANIGTASSSEIDRNARASFRRTNYTTGNSYEFPAPIRQLKHSEVVLVDEVSVHYNKYWLRLRWPGPKGGIAGYIVLGGTNSVPNEKVREWKERLRGAVGRSEVNSVTSEADKNPVTQNSDGEFRSSWKCSYH